MAEAELCLRLKPAGVHADVVGDRALLISFVTGKYVTVTGGGVSIIRALAKGPVDITGFISKYGVETAPFHDFVNTLIGEQLCEWYNYDGEPVPVEFDGNVTLPPIEVDASLADMLTMDPIHDPGPGGWPEKV